MKEKEFKIGDKVKVSATVNDLREICIFNDAERITQKTGIVVKLDGAEIYVDFPDENEPWFFHAKHLRLVKAKNNVPKITVTKEVEFEPVNGTACTPDQIQGMVDAALKEIREDIRRKPTEFQFSYQSTGDTSVIAFCDGAADTIEIEVCKRVARLDVEI